MTALTPEAVLPIEDWQWLADQLRAWPERRVHPERTMCEGVLRPMAADVIEAATARIAELEGALRNVADELESELHGRYYRMLDHPAMKARFDRDMVSVIEAKTLLSKDPAP